MSGRERPAIRCHDDPDLFREAVNFTAEDTAFPAWLIEKDYFCSLLLDYLAARDGALTFKGGTCLTKVYAGFYRLSEDLDFVIPSAVNAPRAERSRLAADVKEAVAAISAALPDFRVIQPLKGANNSTQYLGVVAYVSLLSRQEETIKIEVGLREPLPTPPVQGQVRTILLDPVSGQAMAPALVVKCVSREEAFSEKLRAALSRREVAIRDFYDIDHAVRRLGLRVQAPEIVGLVREKLAVPGNEPMDVSTARLAALRPQVESRLKPVLRAREFAEFDLDRAFATVAGVAAALG